MTSDQVRELATTPAMRGRAVGSESTESAMAEGELFEELGLWNPEGDLNSDLYADLPPLILPSSEPFFSPVSLSSPERHSVHESSPPADSLPSPMMTAEISLT